MTGPRVVGTFVALVVVLAIFELLRRRQLREKYAVLWLVTGLAIVPLAAFPGLVDELAGGLGVASGANLLLFLSVVFLLFVCIHLSWEVSRLEEETRVLAEELALIQLDQDERR